jgi:hypothetical protein
MKENVGLCYGSGIIQRNRVLRRSSFSERRTYNNRERITGEKLMRAKLIIDGNAVYEIDEGCMRRKQTDHGKNCFSEKNGKEHAGLEKLKKSDREKNNP